MNSERTDPATSNLAFVVADLIERVSALEVAARAYETAPGAPPSGSSPAMPPPPTPRTAPAADPPPPWSEGPAPARREAERSGSSFEWGIEALLRWSGVGLVTLAAVFLVSTAVSRGWIGPELQLFGAALGGLGLLGGAMRLADSRRPWSLALGSGGAIVLAVSALATHHWLDVLGPAAAVVLTAVATAASTAVALRARHHGIALVAGLVALLAPLDTLGAIGERAVLLWIVGCVIAATALGLTTAWASVRIVTAWLGALLLLGHAFAEQVDGAFVTMGMICTAVVAVTLWTAPSLAARLPRRAADPDALDPTALDHRLLAAVPGWTWAMIASLLVPITDRDAGVLALGTALAFLALAATTWGRIRPLASTSTVLGGLVLLATGFSVVLDGPALMVTLAGQAAVSYYLANRLDDRALGYSGHVAGAISSMLALSRMLEALGHEGFATAGDGMATLLIVASWIVAAVLLHRNRSPWFDSAFIAGWGGAMLWSAAAIIALPQGLMLISLAWAAMGCIGLVVGLRAHSAVTRNLAMATLGITLCKLVGVDMAEIDVFWRVGLFAVVGTGLIALGLRVPTLLGPAPDEPAEPRGGAPDPVAMS